MFFIDLYCSFAFFFFRFFYMHEAPALHGGLSLAQRCELALCGYIINDLWVIVAEDRSKATKIPRSKMVMAPQTRKNLQVSALAVVTICASKEEHWDCWREAHALSELKIEHRFGQLRAHFQGGEMTARGYWKAHARLMRQMALKGSKKSKDRSYEMICLGGFATYLGDKQRSWFYRMFLVAS